MSGGGVWFHWLRRPGVLAAAVCLVGCSVVRGPAQVNAQEPLWVSEGLSKRLVAPAIETIVRQTNACDARLRGPRRSPSYMRASWVVDGDGSAAMVMIDNSPLANASLEGCFLGLIRRTRFARPRGVAFASVVFRLLLPGQTTAPAATAPGQMQSRSIIHTLRHHARRLDSCYAQRRDKHQALSGQARLEVRVASSGLVEWARLRKSSLGDLQVERCLVAALWTIHFPAPSGGAAQWVFPYVLGAKP